MMIGVSAVSSMNQSTTDRQACYGHRRQVATQCGHDLHPSAPAPTPLCPDCISTKARDGLEAAQTMFLIRGGPRPSKYVRDRAWNMSRLQYEIMKKRVERLRENDQLRWEREEAWEDVHAQHAPLRMHAIAIFQSPLECPICAMRVARYPTGISRAPVAKNEVWWEQLGAPVMQTPPFPKISLRRKTYQVFAPRTVGSAYVCQIIQEGRQTMREMDAKDHKREGRWRIESAVRRKYGLDATEKFPSYFWNEPLPGAASRQRFQHEQEHQRMAEHQQRGHVLRPRLPPSRLSQSRSVEDFQVDKKWVEKQRKRQETTDLERMMRKVATEVGYLYFVGTKSFHHSWKTEYWMSNRKLIWRHDKEGNNIDHHATEYEMELAEVGTDEETTEFEGAEGDGEEQ